MLQEIIAVAIIAIAGAAALVHIIRVIDRIKKKETECSCCDKKNTCSQNKNRK